MLTWISFVFDAGRPRRNVMYRVLARANARGEKILIKGEGANAVVTPRTKTTQGDDDEIFDDTAGHTPSVFRCVR